MQHQRDLREFGPYRLARDVRLGGTMRLALPFALATVSLLSVTAARAESTCEGGYELVGFQPADGQTDVPIDVVPRVFVAMDENSCSAAYKNVVLSLLRDGEAVDETQLQVAGSVITTELILDAPLEVSTTYTFIIEADGPDGAASTSVTFTTGTESAAPVSAPPVIEILSAIYGDSPSETQARHEASFRVTPGTPDPSNLSTIRVMDGEVVLGAYIVGSDPIESEVYFYAPPGTEICLTPVQVNAAGDEQLGEEVCMTPTEDPGEGCSAAARPTRGAPLSLAGFALAAWLLRRRRAA
jgi:uncharacterized protein (TIGR03382 family)